MVMTDDDDDDTGDDTGAVCFVRLIFFLYAFQHTPCHKTDVEKYLHLAKRHLTKHETAVSGEELMFAPVQPG